VHIDGIVAKAHRHANAILRCFVTRDPQLLTRAYIAYVRTILEHDCVTWSPHLKKDIEKIERVQRRYMKRLRGLEGLPYGERLRRLQLCTLELRRLHFDLYTCYRIIFECVSVRVPEFFEFSHAAQTRGHPYKLYRRHSSNSVRSSYFAVRVINVWNSLPAEVWIFPPFWHSNEQSNKLILRRFYLVRRLRFSDF